MRNKWMILSIFASIGLMGCSGESSIATVRPDGTDGSGDECSSECSAKDKPKCVGTSKYKACLDVDKTGCYEWITQKCDSGEVCSDGVCSKTSDGSKACKDECTKGASECMDGETLRNCQASDDGCLKWVNVTCSSSCKDDHCEKGDECEDECTDATVVCDSSNAMKSCMDGDGDGCREIVITPCAEGSECSDGICSPTGKSCSSECTEGATECDGTTVQKTCKDKDGDGCFEWVSSNCVEGAECRNNQCGVLVPPCADTCESSECDGDAGYRECRDTDNDGCKELAETTACSQGQKCEGGACVTPQATCTNACTAGEKQCSDKKIQECRDDNNDGCTEWVDAESCDYKCENKACVSDPNAWVPACTGSDCPTVVTDFTKIIDGDTSKGTNKISKYAGACADLSQAGPEQAYVFKVDKPGFVFAAVTEPAGGDVDIHILSSMSADACLSRADKVASSHVDPGIYYVIADTYANASNAGAYKLKITFIADDGPCGMKSESMARLYGGSTLKMPATGLVVQEAHLVTTNDKSVHGSSWWPSSSSEGIKAHKEYTDKLFGSDTADGPSWCPSGEGGCRYGEGCTGLPVPPEAEAWYINMAWATRPSKGERFLVLNPFTGAAVIAAGGYETGPGDTKHIGGAVYEIHHYLGTKHLSTLTLGRMIPQDGKYGPVKCE